MRVLALDMSLTATGVALPDGSTETLSTWQTGLPRLAWLRDEVAERALTFLAHSLEYLRLVDLVVIEGYAMGTARQSHSYAIGELGGVVRLHLFEHGATFVDVPPASLKKYACGRGNASKDDVFAAAIRRLDYAGGSKDEADALWLRAMALDAYGEPVVTMPAAHRVALEAVPWPELAVAS